MHYIKKFFINHTEYFFGFDKKTMCLIFDEVDINHRGWIQVLEIGDAYDKYNGTPKETMVEFLKLVNASLEKRYGKVDGEFESPLEELLFRIENNIAIVENKAEIIPWK